MLVWRCLLFSLLAILLSFSAAQMSGTDDFTADLDPPVICPGCVSVFYPGLNGSSCWRIPSIIRTHEGTLLAFIENRPVGCADDSKHHHILMVRRSSDGGQNWEYPTFVKIGVPPCPSCPPAISNPNPVEVKKPDGTYSILVHYDTMNNPSAKKHGLDRQIWSHDDGKTWVEDAEISFPPEKNVGGLIGPSTGIQGADGTIYFCNALGFLYYSTDYGKNWNATVRRAARHGECSIALAEAGGEGSTIVQTVRTGTKRSVIMWQDLQPGAPFQPAALVGAACQGSILNLGGTLYISSVGTSTSSKRSHLAIKKSTDKGQTWSLAKTVWDGPSGYSQLVDVGASSKVGLLFEAGKKDYRETISFVVVDLGSANGIADVPVNAMEVIV